MKQINKFTIYELNKINDLLPEDWQTSLHFIINPKDTSTNTHLEVGNKFTIQIENYIINQPSNFSLSEKWNNNTVPPEEILDIEIIQIWGNMIKVKSIGKCTRIFWVGWLPKKSFKII